MGKAPTKLLGRAAPRGEGQTTNFDTESEADAESEAVKKASGAVKKASKAIF